MNAEDHMSMKEIVRRAEGLFALPAGRENCSNGKWFQFCLRDLEYLRFKERIIIIESYQKTIALWWRKQSALAGKQLPKNPVDESASKFPARIENENQI
jgi:hypothetical protein